MPKPAASEPIKPVTPAQVSPPATTTPPAAANTPPAGTPPAGAGAASGGEPEPPDPFAEADAPYLAAMRKVDGEPEPPKPEGNNPPAAAPAAAAPPPKPAAAPAAGKPDPATAGARGANPELRKQYEATKAELETLRTEHGSLQTKITEFEARGKDTEAMRERLAAMEKEHGQLQAELRAYRQEQSPEFKAKYDKPFDDAAASARADVLELEVTNPETGEVRAASWEQDFASIYRMPLAQAVRALKEKFGDLGMQVVLPHYNELKRLERAREKALAEEKAHAAERNKEDENRTATQRVQERALRERVNKEFVEKIEHYRDDPADTEAMEARSKALAVFDAAAPDARTQIIRDAHIRQRVGAYPVLVLKVMRLQQELAALKAGSAGEDPNNPKPRHAGGTGEQGEPQTTWEEDARSLSKQT